MSNFCQIFHNFRKSSVYLCLNLVNHLLFYIVYKKIHLVKFLTITWLIVFTRKRQGESPPVTCFRLSCLFPEQHMCFTTADLLTLIKIQILFS